MSTAALLFDAPGPRALARHRLYGVAVTIAVTAVVAFVVHRLSATGQFDGDLWEWLHYKQIQMALLDGYVNTLRAFGLGAVLAVLTGILLGLGRLSEHKAVRGPATAAVQLFRAMPLVVMMFLFYYGLPAVGITVSTYTAVVAALTVNNGSVLAEVFRAGVLALPAGQTEAAYALGMRKGQAMRLVLLPQAVRAMLPSIVSQLVILLKDSALGFLILYPELLYQARLLGSDGALGRPLLPVAFVVAVIYISSCLLLAALASYLERRTRRSRRAADAC